MKSGLLSKTLPLLMIGGLGLLAGCVRDSAEVAPVRTIASTEGDPAPPVVPVAYEVPVPAEPAPPVMTTPSPETAPATVAPDQGQRPFPANVHPSPAAQQVIQLANSGVDEGVLLSFVTNSANTFNLGADEIIYLTDIGVPGSVISAMLERDQILKTGGPVGTFTGVPSPPPAPNQAAYPPAEEVAPQFDASLAYPPPAAPAPEVNYQEFYTDLSPYGTWVDVEGYGRCWQPTVSASDIGWQPYFDGGHWLYTDCGWYWASDYSWGWAPFHYGRWFHHGRFGWCWAPDTVWGPSWVCWRYSDAYCGWAPLPPGTFFTAGIGFTFRGRPIHDFDDCGLQQHNWRFVGWNDFHDRHFHGHGLPDNQVTPIFNKTVVVNKIVLNKNIVVNQGIPPAHVANVTHHDLHQVALDNRTTYRPGRGRPVVNDAKPKTVAVYHPQTPAPEPAGRPGRAPTSPTAPIVRNGIGAQNLSPAPAAANRTVAPLIIRGSTPTTPGPNNLSPFPTTTTPTRYAPPSRPAPLAPAPAVEAENRTAPPSTPAPQPTPWWISRPAAPVQNPTASRTFAPPQPRITPSQPVNPQPQHPTPTTPTYQPRVAPAPAPARQYTPPPVESRPAPSRPVMNEAPRPSAPAPAPAPPAVHSQPPAQAPAPAPAPSRSAPQPSSDRGSSSSGGRR